MVSAHRFDQSFEKLWSAHSRGVDFIAQRLIYRPHNEDKMDASGRWMKLDFKEKASA